MSTIQSQRVVMGDVIAYADSDHIRGHGTTIVKVEDTDCLIASITGVVQKVNKLITVEPHTARYLPEIGDIVVGRITEVGAQRWTLNINARKNASLLLSSVNLPGGQRIRGDSDFLRMRSYLVEGDLVAAEVQKISHDGSVFIQTRSIKYGKLGHGCLVQVPASLIKRSKVHYNTIDDLGVDLILSHNGSVWICPTPTEDELEQKRQALESMEGDISFPKPEVSLAKRESISRLRNVVYILSKARKFIYRESVLHVYNLSIEMNLQPSKLLLPEFLDTLTQSANHNLL